MSPSREKAVAASTRFKRTRADHRDETAEDYVEAVADLIEQTGEARVRDLAKVMGVSHVTVTRIVSRLCTLGLLSTEPRKPIHLTDDGRQMAQASRERHEVVLSFLKALGVQEENANLDAEGIEHHVSEETLAAMRRYLQSV
ncbi:MAG: manganese-binding transcriptional regulator MntR [Phycisphaerales bacterium]|nr:manganese-binding transcriptional regulator MntR [Phycisphaerales bacterium]